MRGFKLSDGDLAIGGREIEFVTGTELTAQTIQYVLSTNKGEWAFNIDEGINFDNVLGKHRITRTSAEDSYYLQELTQVREENNDAVQRLNDRLNGE